MQLDIRGRNLRLTPALLDHVERRMRLAVARLAAGPARVAVRVEEEKGGAGKRCRIHVEVAGRALSIEEVDPDLYAAIDRAAVRAGRATAPFRAA